VASNNIVWGPGSPLRPGNAFEVLAGQPLDELRSPTAAAFGCSCSARPDESFVALVSDPALPPRHDLIEKLATAQLTNVMTPVGWGFVDLPGLPPSSWATVFERPRGARLVSAITEAITPLSADDVMRKVLPPLVATLRAFADARMTHRAIRPSNLFHQGEARQLMLGDAVSAPPGVAQPLAYETIEGGMAQPHCRGAGTSADDLYALGVTVVFLLMGKDATVAVDPNVLMRTKIDRGSFMAIVGNARLPPESSELIRGLLNDDVRERWTIEDVENWLQGRRLKPRQQTASSVIATRPFDFAGRTCYTARAVADAFAKDPSAAARAIRSSEFEIWLQRSLADEKRSQAVTSVRSDLSDSRSNLAQDLRLTARTCIALDPAAPIRYGDFAVAIDTFNYALAGAFNGRGSLQTIGEMLTARLPQLWIAFQSSGLPPHLMALTTAKPFEMLRRFAEDPRAGFGLERVLYELNPAMHCLSPVIQAERVCKVSELLTALEAAAARGTLGEGFIDRHIAAFVATHSRHLGRECFDFLGGSPRQRVLGTIGILAHLQGAHGPVTVPALGKLIAGQATSLVDMFHSRQRRVRVRTEIAKLAEKGALSDLFWLLNGSSEPPRDAHDFAVAQQEYAAIEKALAHSHRSEASRPARAVEVGGRGGVVTASFVATAIAVIAILRVW
jgi:eukaryotic-like serine/threonine-protein kinase